jgi:hypothetical protein
MKCVMCARTVFETPMYRVNEKGVSGAWACKDHAPALESKTLRQAREELEPIVDAIVEAGS